jgi:CheY-like chemotaxis protein
VGVFTFGGACKPRTVRPGSWSTGRKAASRPLYRAVSQGELAAVGASSVEKAIKAIESNQQIDAAVVDVNLGGAMAFPVADALLARNIPFIFTSGYEGDALRERYPQIKNCLKPYLFPEMERALASAIPG